MCVNYINNETPDFLGAQQNYVCCKKLKRLRKQWIAPLMPIISILWLDMMTCSPSPYHGNSRCLDFTDILFLEINVHFVSEIPSDSILAIF